MRIADVTINRQSMEHLQKLRSNIFEASQQVISGQRFERASDAPQAATRSLGLQQQIDNYKLSQEKTEVAQIRLTDLENKVDQLNNVFNSVQSQLMRAGSATGASPEALKDIGVILESDINQIVAIINQQGVFGDTYFSGGAEQAIELQYDASGQIIAANYVGADKSLAADVGGGLKVKTDMPIANFLAGTSVAAVPPATEPTVTLETLNKLIAFSNHLQDTATPLDVTMQSEAKASLEAMHDAMNTITIETGQSASLLDRIANSYEDLTLALELQLANVAGIDEIESIAKFQEQQTLYKTFLRITAEMSNNSLFDVISR